MVDLAKKVCGMSDIVCPFCGEKGFDLVGLKYHLLNYCNLFLDTESIR